ncbi:unnamed protein product [Mytilus coruscus]|uniref:Uncharacterized protein n=1 Tax=Mytilus coruscus TaxID=42192 RepID=A0A6J8AFE5_MYTCO|nr:unnamed protein product [Mytilus coruscus]
MHITSNKNCIADAISRQQWPRFRRLSPDALKTRKGPTVFSTSDLKFESNKVLTASISPNTSDIDETAIRSFDQFRSSHGHAIVWPPSLNVICNFIAYLSVREIDGALFLKLKVDDLQDLFKSFVKRKKVRDIIRDVQVKEKPEEDMPVPFPLSPFSSPIVSLPSSSPIPPMFSPIP